MLEVSIFIKSIKYKNVFFTRLLMRARVCVYLSRDLQRLLTN